MEYQIVTELLKIQEQTLFSLLCNAMELPTYTYTYLIHYRRYCVLTKNEERVRVAPSRGKQLLGRTDYLPNVLILKGVA